MKNRNIHPAGILFFFAGFLLLQVMPCQSAYAADVQPISFLDNPDPVPAGGTVEYTVVVQNNDTQDPAQDPTLTVSVPVGFSFISSDHPLCHYDGVTPSTGAPTDVVLCDSFPIPLVFQQTIVFQYAASNTAGTYQVTATADATNDNNPGNNSEFVNTDVVESADLELTEKSAIPDPVAAGGIVTYRFSVTNNGPYPATGLSLIDNLPPGLTFFADDADPSSDQDGDWACSATGQDVTCSATSLALGATSVFYFRVQVTSATTGAIDNAATINSVSPDSDPDNNTTTDTLTILEGTDMSVSKTVDTDPVIGGQPMQFTVTVNNEGPMTAEDIEVVDTLPTGYTDISIVTTPPGWSCGVNGLQITCTNPSVPAGESADIVLQATPPAVSDVVNHQNQASVSTTTTDPIQGNNSDTVTYPVSPDTADLDLSKSKSPDPVAQGDIVTSTIVVENNGPRPADPVQVVDQLSDNETYIGIDPDPNPDWSCSHSGANPDGTGGTVTCDYLNAPLQPGSTAPDLNILTGATNGGVLTNTACTGGAGGSLPPQPWGDSLTGNNCSDGSVTSTTDRADVVVSKTTSDTLIEPGETSFDYTIVVHNDGPEDALSVDLNDTIPQYVAPGPGGRPGTSITALTTQGTCTVTNAQVHCALGDIAYTGNTSSDVTVTITVERPMLDGDAINTASAYSTLVGDPNRGNNIDSAQMVTVEPVTDIEVTDKSVTYADYPDPILAGTVATYTIQVRNNGPSIAENVVLTDVFSGEPFVYVDSTIAGSGLPCSFTAPTLTCNLGNMNPSTVDSVTVRIQPDHLLTVTNPPWQIDNTAVVSMTTTDSDPTNNDQDLNMPVQRGEADLVVEKNEAAGFSEPVRFDPDLGQPNYIVYEIEITNRGPSLATGVYFIDNVTSVFPVQTPVQNLQFVRDTENSDGSAGTFSLCTPPAPNPFPIDGSLQDIRCDLINDPARTLGELASGESYSRFLVFEVLNSPDPISGDSYHDQALVSANEDDLNPANNEEDENTTVRTIVDLGIVKDGPVAPVEVEEHFNFTLVVTNHGPGDSPLTVVTDNLPANMELTGSPATDTGTCTGASGGTSFTCDLGTMLKDAVANITIPVKLTAYPPGGTITNTASVAGQAPEPLTDPHPNQDDHLVTVYEPATLGNYVWLDGDADGIQDGTESGIAGVTVNLLDSAGNPVLDPNSGLPVTTTTSGSGYYSFTINHAASYIVEFVRPDASYLSSPQNAGGDDNLDSDAAAATGRTGVVVVNYGDNNLTVDAGLYQLVSVGNRVWEDLDADGIQDPGELNLSGVFVELLDTGDAVLASTTTDANGNYLFTDLEPDDYRVRITPPAWAGYLAGPVQTADPNNDVNTDSNIAAEPVSGTFQSGLLTLTSNAEPTNDGDTDSNTNLSLDFGLVLPGSIGNRIWLDENSDGIQDAGEAGLANVTVELRDSTGALITTTVTDVDGGYLFAGLAPGDFFITVDGTTLPAGISQSTIYPDPGADFVNQDQSGNGYPVHLTSGGEDLTADFGYNWPGGALGDRVWIDSNGNGIQDTGEVGVSGVQLTLYSAGPDGLFWTADDLTEDSTSTDASGNYIFSGLGAGAYAVEVTDSGAASHDILALASYGQTGDPDHFGADSAAAPTGTAGDNRSTQPVIVAPNDTFVNVDFGYQPEPAAAVYNIGDRVWMDNDRNGVLDAGEAGITGVVIGLQDSTGAFIATTTTDATGNYLFEDLVPGDYTVVVIDSDNVLSEYNSTYDQDSGTTNPDGQSTLTLAAADDLDQDFGYAPNAPSTGTGLIGDTVFFDRDNSGTFDIGEGIEGARVTLSDSGGNVLAVTYTDENGNYSFGGLAAGGYLVTVDTTTLPAGISNSVDPDGGFDSTSAVTLTAGEINLDQDFGYVADTPGSIGDLVWKDTNADGIYQPDGLDGSPGTPDDETVFAGITMELYWDANNNAQIDPGEPRVAATVTDGSGTYLFDGLPAASYNVKVTDTAGILSGYWHSTGSVNTNDNSQVEYYPVVLPAGGTINYADFGYYVEPGSVGDRVWKDEDVNGLFVSGTDIAIAGVTVYLDIEYPDGTPVTVQTVTDSNGLYTFPNLLLDERYNGIGVSYGSGGEEPSHTVRVETSDIPAGQVSIYASRGSNSDTSTVGGAAADEDDQDMGSDDPAGEPGYPPMGSEDPTNDFGYFEPGSIGDTVWHDINNDGIVDGGEPLANITITLTPPADVDLGGGLGVPVTTSTDGSGNYLFANLPLGNYTVTVDEATLPAVLQGANTVDPDGGLDSTSAVTLSVSAGKVEDNLDQDFAYFVPSAIGNYVWDDSNGNGIQDGNESGHQAIAVHLLDAGGNPVDDPLHPGTPYVVQTGPAGEYLFENLIPGTYQVHFILPFGNAVTAQNSGVDDSVDSDPDGTGLVTVVLAPSETNLTVDAGLVGTAINIEKSTNGVDADTPPGVSLTDNDPVTWTYVVTNTGDVELSNVYVTDDRLGAIACPSTILAVRESMTCTATGTAVVGQYANMGSVIGTPPEGPAVLDSDPSHYLADSQAPAIDIEKATNGVDADTGTGPVITIGDPVSWTYVVTNTGNADLTNVTVTDNRIGMINCPQSSLGVGASMTCTATGTAVAGQYVNIGSVSATPPSGPNVGDSDPSHYYGSTPGSDFAAVDIEKATDGLDADQAPGPYAETGYGVSWTYLVTNTGNVDLTNVTITDNLVADTDIHCPNDGNTDNRITLLPVGGSATCTATSIAVSGQYENTGYVVGTPPIGPDVTDEDLSHYYGTTGSVSIEKSTNGEDADVEPGPTIKLEEEVVWTYVVTNTGPFSLNGVVVSDNQGVVVTCPKDTLAAGESMTCTGQGISEEGQYENIGTVVAETPNGVPVTDEDPSHYFGKTFPWKLFIPIYTPKCPPVPDFCYLVADGDNESSTNSPLFKYTFATDKLELLNHLGADNVETIALSLDGKTLYGADGGVLGIIDSDASSNSFTPINPAGAGTAQGQLGAVEINDIDGLAFDPTDSTLYGTVRLGDDFSNLMDLLIKLDTATGRVIADGFGTGVDYLVIQTAPEGVHDVDDIAIDSDGTMYGIAANSGFGDDHLVIIDKTSGVVTDHGALHHDQKQIQDMEGLTLYNTKILYGTTGMAFEDEGTANTLYRIEKATGATTTISRLDKDFNGYIPSDFEAVSCFPICK